MSGKRGDGKGKGKPKIRPVKTRQATRPGAIDRTLRLLRVLNERRVLSPRIVADEFGIPLRTARRYLLSLSDLPCVIVDEEKGTCSPTSDYVVSDRLLTPFERSMVCALIDLGSHIFGPEHSRTLTGLKNKIFRIPDVCGIVQDEAIDMDKVASNQLALERRIKAREVVSFSYRKSGKRVTAEPYKILYLEGFWYLVARHEGETKRFSLDRIEDLRPTGKRYPKVPESVRNMLAKSQTARVEDRETMKVAVEFDASVAHFFQRKNVFPHQEIVETREDGNVVVSFRVDNETHFHEQTARWMPYFRVLSPDAYRQRVCAIGLETAARNESEAG